MSALLLGLSGAGPRGCARPLLSNALSSNEKKCAKPQENAQDAQSLARLCATHGLSSGAWPMRPWKTFGFELSTLDRSTSMSTRSSISHLDFWSPVALSEVEGHSPIRAPTSQLSTFQLSTIELSTFDCQLPMALLFQPNPFRMRTYAKTCLQLLWNVQLQIIGLKVPWNEHLQKTPGVGASAVVANAELSPHLSLRRPEQSQIIGLKVPWNEQLQKTPGGGTPAGEKGMRIRRRTCCPDRSPARVRRAGRCSR
jgi:hypothetical protein